MTLYWTRYLITIVIPLGLSGCDNNKQSAFDDIFRLESSIELDSRDEYLIGPLPRFGTVTPDADLLILDVTPRIGVFDSNGTGKGIMGSAGDGPGEYRYPLSLTYHGGDTYLYDMTLSRISRFNGSFDFTSSLISSVRLDGIEFADDGRCFGFGDTGNEGDLIFELDRQGQVVRQFAPQSKNFNYAASSRGGGLVMLKEHVYIITPYEYELRKYTLDGELMDGVQGRSPHYAPPPEQYDPQILDDFEKLQSYHNQWSHILQLVQIGEQGLGVVFAEAGYSRFFMDLYDSDLSLIASDIQLPEYMGYPGALYTRESRLYLLVEPSDDQANPSVVVYELRQPLGAL